MSTPKLHLHTAFVLNEEGRITSTREPGAQPDPLFSLVRSSTRCAWAIRADVPQEIACELERQTQKEPPPQSLSDAPVYADRYRSLLGNRSGSGAESVAKTRHSAGPLFVFPAAIAPVSNIVVVEDERLLDLNFQGWTAGEIAAERAPVLAIVEDGFPVSVCFCAWRSEVAAEVGLETAVAYRGLAPRVTAAWALAIRATRRIPLYSTFWTNTSSLAVARKLGLIAFASHWGLHD